MTEAERAAFVSNHCRELLTQELIGEIQRRSIGCLVVVMRADASNQDIWEYALKGSPQLLGAMSGVLTVRMSELLSGEA